MRMPSVAYNTILCLMIAAVTVLSQPCPVTWEDLDSLKNGKVPKNAKLESNAGLFGKGSYFKITLLSPRGRAANFAAIAEDEFIKLDSSNYNPEKFTKHAQIFVENILAGGGKKE